VKTPKQGRFIVKTELFAELSTFLTEHLFGSKGDAKVSLNEHRD